MTITKEPKKYLYGIAIAVVVIFVYLAVKSHLVSGETIKIRNAFIHAVGNRFRYPDRSSAGYIIPNEDCGVVLHELRKSCASEDLKYIESGVDAYGNKISIMRSPEKQWFFVSPGENGVFDPIVKPGGGTDDFLVPFFDEDIYRILKEYGEVDAETSRNIDAVISKYANRKDYMYFNK